MTGTACLIALGSNIGDRLGHLTTAATSLSAHAGFVLTGASRLYETAPVGGPSGQGAFLNAAIAGRFDGQAGELLEQLHAIEVAHERTRETHWGPRTLDLDLLLFGDLVVTSPELTVPHPRMHERRFVMEPVCDLAPQMVHPVLGVTLAALAAALPVEPGDLNVAAESWI